MSQKIQNDKNDNKDKTSKQKSYQSSALSNARKYRKQYAQQFVQISQKLIHGPIRQRKDFTDPACLLFLAIFIGSFFTLGGYQINQYKKIQENPQNNMNDLYIANHIGSIMVGVFSSLLISYGFILAFNSFTKVMLYLNIVLCQALLMIAVIVGISEGIMGLFISMLVLVFIYAICVYCFFDSIKTGMAFLALSTKFSRNFYIVYALPLINLFFAVGIAIFHTYALSATFTIKNYKFSQNLSSGIQVFFIVILFIFWFFFVFIFYYMIAYMQSYLYGLWYYKKQLTTAAVKNGYIWMFKQIGSITFASLSLVIFTLSSALSGTQSSQPNNKAEQFYTNIVIKCLTQKLEQAINYLDNFAIIIMTLTGKSYFQSAKLAYGLLYKYPNCKKYTSVMCKFVTVWGITLSFGIPLLIGYFILQDQTNIIPQQQIMTLVTIGITSLLISSMVFEIIGEGICCTFVFVALDSLFYERGQIMEEQLYKQLKIELNAYSGEPNLQAVENQIRNKGDVDMKLLNKDTKADSKDNKDSKAGSDDKNENKDTNKDKQNDSKSTGQDKHKHTGHRKKSNSSDDKSQQPTAKDLMVEQFKQFVQDVKQLDHDISDHTKI